MPAARASRVLLVHGAATTARCWDTVADTLRRSRPGLPIVAPERPCTGNLPDELAALTELAQDAFVVGVSGGATLGLALAASDVTLAGALLHEPAVGSLLPGLLTPMAQAFSNGGVTAFGKQLYGPSWSPEMAPAVPGAVARDLAMFSAFEPTRPRSGQGPVVVTTGADSPPVRHHAAAALAEHLGLTTVELTGCRHFIQVERPTALSHAVLHRLAS